MARRLNIAMLIVRVKFMGFYQINWSEVYWKFYQIQLSVDGCWEMKMWLHQKLIQICSVKKIIEFGRD